MSFTRQQVEENAAWFRARLQAVTQKKDVVDWAKGEGPGSFVLVDVRPRDAFRAGHVPGAVNVPFEEIESLAAGLPRDQELVTFCWSHT